VRTPLHSTPQDRWAVFLARTNFTCPTCGYNLHGLRTHRCPECGHEVDTETAMFVGAPVKAGVLWRTAVSLWAVVFVNIGLWAAVSLFLPVLECSRWTSRPPTEWYGLLILRMVWLGLFMLGAALWWLDLLGASSLMDGLRKAMTIGARLALAMTILHALWAGLRFTL
jgi:hypothetical protein